MNTHMMLHDSITCTPDHAHVCTHMHTHAHTPKRSEVKADLKKCAHSGDIFRCNRARVLLKLCVTEGTTTNYFAS